MKIALVHLWIPGQEEMVSESIRSARHFYSNIVSLVPGAPIGDAELVIQLDPSTIINYDVVSEMLDQGKKFQTLVPYSFCTISTPNEVQNPTNTQLRTREGVDFAFLSWGAQPPRNPEDYLSVRRIFFGASTQIYTPNQDIKPVIIARYMRRFNDEWEKRNT